LAVLLAGGLPCPSAFAADPGALLVNFADYRHDPDGTTMRPFEYAYGDWDKHVSAYRNQGTLVAAATGKGGMGDNHASLNLGGCPAVEMVLVVGNGNQAATLSLLLEDKDGTGHVWNLPLSDKPKGREVRYRLDLLKPDYVQAPGKTPGLNKSKIAVWQLRGDNESPRVEVLALKLVEAQ
jgi:hypothetical protein